jgi:hypothetical protein
MNDLLQLEAKLAQIGLSFGPVPSHPSVRNHASLCLVERRLDSNPQLLDQLFQTRGFFSVFLYSQEGRGWGDWWKRRHTVSTSGTCSSNSLPFNYRSEISFPCKKSFKIAAATGSTSADERAIWREEENSHC